ncbi:MAG: universal stress protein [Myxococcales bacterium]
MHSKPGVIVVGVDFSDLGYRAFQQAHELAASSANSELHAVFVRPTAAADALTGVREPAGPAHLEHGATQLTEHVSSLLFALGGHGHPGMRVYSHFRVDVPLYGIIQLATEVRASFIVLGTHGQHGVAGWLLGSVAEGVLRQAPCPVLLVPPEATTKLPKREPACPACVEARNRSIGQEPWCEQHRRRQRHSRRATYREPDRTSGDSLVTR